MKDQFQKLQSDFILLRAQLFAMEKDLKFQMEVLFNNSNSFISYIEDIEARLNKLEEKANDNTI